MAHPKQPGVNRRLELDATQHWRRRLTSCGHSIIHLPQERSAFDVGSSYGCQDFAWEIKVSRSRDVLTYLTGSQADLLIAEPEVTRVVFATGTEGNWQFHVKRLDDILPYLGHPQIKIPLRGRLHPEGLMPRSGPNGRQVSVGHLRAVMERWSALRVWFGGSYVDDVEVN